MSLKIREFYALRVEDLKPVLWQQLSETLDAGELVYLCGGNVERVIIAGEGVCVHPKLRETSEH